MSKAKILKENELLIEELSITLPNITELAKEFCKRSNRQYTDSWRRAVSKYLSKNKSSIRRMSIKSVWGKPGAYQYSYKIDHSKDEEDTFRTDLIKDLKQFSPSKFEIPEPDHTKDCVLEICMPDFHIGRGTPEEERKLWLESFQSLYSRARKNYDIHHIELPIGNDFLNSDNPEYRTTRGTQQFDYQKWYTSFRTAWQLLAETIEYISEDYKVNVRSVLGNHDKTRMFYVADVIGAYFQNNKNVEVFNEVNKYHHFLWGKNLVMYDHGEIKPADYPLVMATEFPLDFSKSVFREVHTGHIHVEKVLEFRGIKVRHLPSLAKNSDWEKSRSYSHLRQAQGLVWHKKHGLIDIIQYNVN